MRRKGQQSFGTGFTLSRESVNILAFQKNKSEYTDDAIKEKDLRDKNPRLIVLKLDAEMKELAKKIYEKEQMRNAIQEQIKIIEQAKEKKLDLK